MSRLGFGIGQRRCRATRFYAWDDPPSSPSRSISFARRRRHRAADPRFADGGLPRLSHRAGLGPRAGAHCRCRARPCQAHGERRAAHHGIVRGCRLCALPPCAQPGALGQPHSRLPRLKSLGFARAQVRAGADQYLFVFRSMPMTSGPAGKNRSRIIVSSLCAMALCREDSAHREVL
jgi:hypothetical protein